MYLNFCPCLTDALLLGLFCFNYFFADILNLRDAADLEETSTGEDAGRNKSQSSVESVAGDKSLQPFGSGSRTDTSLTKQTKRPGAKSVNGTRFTIERVHEHVLLSSSKDSEGRPSFKQAGESTGTKPHEKTDMHHTSGLVSHVILSSNDATSHPHSVTKLEQDSQVVLSDKMIKVVDEVDLTHEDGESKNNGDQVATEKSSAREGQHQGFENNVKPKQNCEKAVQKEYEEQLEAGQEEYEVQLMAGQQRYRERLAEEIKKLEQENEKAIERHREILAQRLEESIRQMETDQVHKLYVKLLIIPVLHPGFSGNCTEMLKLCLAVMDVACFCTIKLFLSSSNQTRLQIISWLYMTGFYV